MVNSHPPVNILPIARHGDSGAVDTSRACIGTRGNYLGSNMSYNPSIISAHASITARCALKLNEKSHDSCETMRALYEKHGRAGRR